MFKVNNKYTRTTPLASSVVNFEHVIASWEDTRKKNQLRALDMVESQSKKMWLVSCIT